MIDLKIQTLPRCIHAINTFTLKQIPSKWSSDPQDVWAYTGSLGIPLRDPTFDESRIGEISVFEEKEEVEQSEKSTGGKPKI